MKFNKYITATALGVAVAVIAGMSHVSASSHREAPFITEMPKVDGTDFYMFRSYEAGRNDNITLIANYYPLQDAYGGPNYFALDPEALYEIHIDNDGDSVEDITFQFRFSTTQQDVKLNIGNKQVSIPLINTGPFTAADTSKLHRQEDYTLKIIQGDRRSGTASDITDLSGNTTFIKPVDNIGNKSIVDYATYANSYIHDIAIPGCSAGRVFVGQRKEPFSVNLGEIFDLVNTNPLGAPNAEVNVLANKNITSIALEIPRSCLTGTGNIIGAWTTASLRQARVLNRSPKFATNKAASIEGGAWTQVSRLGSPLVNEVVIGVVDKDRFNASEPKDDADPLNGFADYVTNPTLPALLEILFGVKAPTLFPRADLVQAFLTGVPGLNQPAGVAASEMLRLNVTTAELDAASQNPLGVIAGDNAGFPNGRRPGDDVVDIALRVVMGVLLPLADAPDGQLAYTDGAEVNAGMFDSTFPYFKTPLAGSPGN